MLTYIELPFTPERARDWMKSQDGDSEVYRLAITTKEGHLAGACALVILGKSGTVTGWIGRDRWRNGYGGEAARGLVTVAYTIFPALEQLECGVMHDNIAAIRILQNLGFEQTGEVFAKSPARDEETSECLFRLTRSKVAS